MQEKVETEERLFDVEKVEEKLKQVKKLSDLTGPGGVFQELFKKTFKTSSGAVEREIPRDRERSFEPQLIAKHQRFDPDLEQRVTSMVVRGMSVRDIQDQLEEFYGAEVSPALISKITDSVLEGLKEWQNRKTQVQLCVVHQIRASFACAA